MMTVWIGAQPVQTPHLLRIALKNRARCTLYIDKSKRDAAGIFAAVAGKNEKIVIALWLG